MALAVLTPPAFALWVKRRVITALDRYPRDPSHGQFIFARGSFIVQWVLGALSAGLLLLTDWQVLCCRIPVVGNWLLVPSLAAIAPFLCAIVLVWVALYPADRAVRQIAIEVYLFRGKPVHPVWSLGEYVIHNLRHQVLFILIPMLMILAARDVVQWYTEDLRDLVGYEFFPDMLLGCAAVAVALITPEILRHVWVTTRLPDGPLRDRLLAVSQKVRVRCREILIWRAGGTLVNAAVMGIIAPLRYVLITDGMLEQMEDQKIEAVYGHEVGHIKRHHIFHLLCFALISGCLVTVFSVRTQGAPPATYQTLGTVLGVVLFVKWGVLFGWVSRRFECQADVYGVRTLALSGLPCYQSCAMHGQSPAEARLDVHDSQVAAPKQPATASSSMNDPQAPLCLTAAQVYGTTLNDVAMLNGIPPESGSWRHGSIAARVRLVQSFAAMPDKLRAFERCVFRVKAAILLVSSVSVVWALYELRLWQLVDGLWRDVS